TGGTADRNRSHWSTSKTPSYTKSVSWQHHLYLDRFVWLEIILRDLYVYRHLGIVAKIYVDARVSSWR
ncbi:hypothetical protein, partial [Yersinia enterocolitica]|uniref:hypothetical protein n=1 Tax=Yersinia enterocolitica TaxID=630 RepID=UPI003F441C2A